MRERVRRTVYAVYVQLRERPMASWMTFAATFAGASALLFGERGSRAFTEIGSVWGDLIVRLLGLFLLVGGTLTTYGVIRSRTFSELLGLGLTAAGAFIYSIGVFFGLGRSGFIAGGLSMGLAVGATFRVMLIAQAAKTVYSHETRD